jgi:hypothetical protein
MRRLNGVDRAARRVGRRIPEAADHTTGATVTISDCVVSGNRVTAGPPHSRSDRHGPRLTWRRGNAGSNG